MILRRKHPLTGEYHEMSLPLSYTEFMARLRFWQEGSLIQDVFQMLTADQREFIKTGLVPEGWPSLPKHKYLFVSTSGDYNEVIVAREFNDSLEAIAFKNEHFPDQKSVTVWCSVKERKPGEREAADKGEERCIM